MPDAAMPNFGTTLADIVARTAEGKNGGGQGPAQAFGQAGGAPAAARPAAADDSQQPEQPEQPEDSPFEQYLNAGPDENDPIGKFREQQLNLATAGRFASNPRSANNMGPNTSMVLAMHGNKLRANAENWDRYMRNLQLEAEMMRLGIIGDPSGRSGIADAVKEELEKQKKKESVTPSGFNPAATDKPAADPATAKPSGSAGPLF